MPKLTQNSVETSRIENRDINLPNAPQLVNFEALDDADPREDRKNGSTVLTSSTTIEPRVELELNHVKTGPKN
jgi:hypothetical protein